MIIGTCNLCGGPVEVPDSYMSIFPPAPTCRHCGATAKPNYGRTIEMEPRKPWFPSLFPKEKWTTTCGAKYSIGETC